MAKPKKCQHCDKPATIHLTQIVNNTVHKVDLCEDCSFKHNVTDPEAFSLADFLIQPEGLEKIENGTSNCPSCGFKPTDFKKTGRFGCPDCYAAFHEMIQPMLGNMHKDVVHRGKVPERALERVGIQRRVDEMERELQDAVSEENYEEAARLRDALRDLRERVEAATKVE